MRIPYGLNFGFTTIFRFIPTMYGEAQLIFLAQEARGVDLRRGSIFQKIKNTVPTIAPLFITTLRRAGELVMAIESRAFLLKKERTSYYEIKFKLGDYILVIFSIILTVFFLWLRIQGYGIVLPTAI
jgi:energy-coupling factor transport system permease protein